jgi:hypothetical protein
MLRFNRELIRLYAGRAINFYLPVLSVLYFVLQELCRNIPQNFFSNLFTF